MKALVQLGILTALGLAPITSARAMPQRLHANPRRAEKAWELAHRQPFPGSADGGYVLDGHQFWWIGASAPTGLYANRGVQAVIQEVDSPPPQGTGCFDCWVSDYSNEGLWGQVGFASCSSVMTFYQVWDTNVTPPVLLVDGEFEVTGPGLHTYAMVVQNGSTWGYSVDGQVFGSYDMIAGSSSGGIQTTCEEGDGLTAPFTPPEVSVPVAMSLLVLGGQWQAAPSAEMYNTAGLSGAAGNLQDSSLGLNEIRIGGDSPYLTPGSLLWNGSQVEFAPDAGPAGSGAIAPPLVSLQSPKPNSTVAGIISLSGSVTPGDTALASTTFYVNDSTGRNEKQFVATGAVFAVPWDTTEVANGQHYIYLEVVDTLGRHTYVDIGVEVANPGGSSGSSSGSGGADPGQSSPIGGCSSATGAGALFPIFLMLIGWRRRRYPDSLGRLGDGRWRLGDGRTSSGGAFVS